MAVKGQVLLSEEGDTQHGISETLLRVGTGSDVFLGLQVLVVYF